MHLGAYTLFSFAQEKHALDRVQLESFSRDSNGSPGMDVLERLQKFEVCNAHCYDPNEEARLQMVIQAGDAKRFNAKIQKVAIAIVDKEKHSYSSRHERRASKSSSYSSRHDRRTSKSSQRAL